MLLSALACLLLLSTIAAPPAHAANAPLRIMPIGDSITMGQSVGVPVGEAVGYRPGLKSKLEAAGVPIDFVGSQREGAFPDNEHEGHGGQNAAQIATYLPSSIAANHPQVALVLVGANDVATVPDRAVRNANYRAMLATIYVADPAIEVLVSTVTPSNVPERAARVLEMNMDLPGIVAAQRAAGQHIRLADVGGQLALAQTGDGTHPTAEGYELLARGWTAAVLDLVNHPTTACNPRPRVTIESTPVSGGVIHVTATAMGQGGPIQSVTFGSGRNVQPVTDLSIVGSRATFTVRRAAPTGAYTQSFTVTDQCGSWPSFVGAGS